MPNETVVDRNYYRQRRSHPDLLIARLAEGQHGVVGHAQLIGLGLTADDVDYRLRIGRLHLLHRGVYAVGRGEVSLAGRFSAAVLAIGDGAVLSHRSAAILWGLLRPAPGPVDVCVERKLKSRRGIHVHEAHDAETTRRDRIPVTTPARTLLDLAGTAIHDRHLERAVHEAQVQLLTNAPALSALLERSRGRRGTARLASVIAPGPAPTRSDLEDRALRLMREHGLRPQINTILLGLEVDFLFPAQRLVIETDGARYHETNIARRRDARRDATLRAAGYTVLRLTWDEVTRHADQTGQRIRRALRS